MSVTLPSLPSMGPLSTVCEMQQWRTIPLAEALATKEPFVRTSSHGDLAADRDAKVDMCEVFRFVRVSVDEVLRIRDPGHCRCVECKMPVRAHRAATNGMAAHFEHLKKNDSCSLSDRR